MCVESGMEGMGAMGNGEEEKLFPGKVFDGAKKRRLDKTGREGGHNYRVTTSVGLAENGNGRGMDRAGQPGQCFVQTWGAAVFGPALLAVNMDRIRNVVRGFISDVESPGGFAPSG